MKKVTLFAMLIMALLMGCKKDEETVDPRDQFIGNYQSTTSISIPDLDYYENIEGTASITKISEDGKIKITNDDGSSYTAKVSGNSYIIDKMTDIENMDGETVIFEMDGTGHIDGAVINESGTYNVSAQGNTYNGTFTCTMTKN